MALLVRNEHMPVRHLLELEPCGAEVALDASLQPGAAGEIVLESKTKIAMPIPVCRMIDNQIKIQLRLLSKVIMHG